MVGVTVAVDLATAGIHQETVHIQGAHAHHQGIHQDPVIQEAVLKHVHLMDTNNINHLAEVGSLCIVG